MVPHRTRYNWRTMSLVHSISLHYSFLLIKLSLLPCSAPKIHIPQELQSNYYLYKEYRQTGSKMRGMLNTEYMWSFRLSVDESWSSILYWKTFFIPHYDLFISFKWCKHRQTSHFSNVLWVSTVSSIHYPSLISIEIRIGIAVIVVNDGGIWAPRKA